MRVWNSLFSTCPLSISIFKARRRVKRNLWFSYRPLTEYEWISKVRYSIIFEILFWATGDFLDLNHENKAQRNHMNKSKYIGKTNIWTVGKICVFLPGYRLIKKLQELSQWSLVHIIDHAHCCEKEIKNASTCSNRSIFLLSSVNLHFRFCCHRQLDSYFSSCLLSCLQDTN